MDGKVLMRIAAIVFVAFAITATAVDMTRTKDPTRNVSAPMVPHVTDDPLREGHRRCQRMGEAAARDPECLRVWAATRDRFLGRIPSSVSHSNEER